MNRKLQVVAWAGALFAATTLVSRIASADCTPEQIGQWGGTNETVAVIGTKAIYSEGPKLLIADITNPAMPVAQGRIALPGEPNCIRVNATYAYVGLVSGYLAIVNHTNPSNPTLTGLVALPGAGLGVAINGNYAYVAMYFDGFAVVDISNPASPTLVGTHGATCVDVSILNATQVVGAGYSNGVRVFNVSNPAAPTVAGTLPTANSISKVTVAGSHAYVSGSFNGYKLVNLANPLAPTELLTHDTGGFVGRVLVSETRAYLCDNDELTVVNVTNPLLPTTLGSYNPSSGFPQDLALSGNHVVAPDYDGLRIINVTNPASMSTTSYTPGNGYVGDLAYSNGYAYTVEGGSRVDVVNLSDLTNPVRVNSVAMTSRSQAVALANGKLYASDIGGNFRAFSLANPAAPALLGQLNGAPAFQDMIVHSGGAYVLGVNGSTLRAVNVANPTVPVLGGSTNVAFAFRLVQYGNYVYTGGGLGTLSVCDISNPQLPAFLTTINLPTASYAGGMVVSGNRLFVPAGNLHIFDLTNPLSPTLLGTAVLPDVSKDVKLRGVRAYVAMGYGGVAIVDVSNPASPVVLTSEPAPGFMLELEIGPGNTVLGAIQSGGLVIDKICNVGDVNCDSAVNLLDHDAFVTALINPSAYAAAYPNCFHNLADLNGDGAVNGLDVQEFVNIVTQP